LSVTRGLALCKQSAIRAIDEFVMNLHGEAQRALALPFWSGLRGARTATGADETLAPTQSGIIERVWLAESGAQRIETNVRADAAVVLQALSIY
jgi:hypothetical protein